jgi:fatty acid desaturase
VELEMADASDTLTRNQLVGVAKALKGKSPLGPTREIMAAWTHITAAMTIFFLVNSSLLYLPLLVFISARQYALLILLHDGQHQLLHPKKSINRWLATWLIAAPMGTEFDSSQRSHLQHHFHLGDADHDPDYDIYCYGPPSPKQTRAQLFASFATRILGGKLFSIVEKLIFHRPAQAPQGESTADPHNRSFAALLGTLGPIAMMQLVIFLLLTLAFGWIGYLGFWIAPLATLAVFYNDFRIFSEHSIPGCDPTDKAERLTSFNSNPVERFFFAPHNMNYHAEHHIFPFVPHSQLPALRVAIRRCPEVNAQIEWRGSYIAHLMNYVLHLRASVSTPQLNDGTAPSEATHRAVHTP